MAFKPALIVVDFQNDFCPPNGSLAVPNGLSISSTVNTLLNLPFSLKIATRDWHPPTHISFASNHPSSPPPFTSTTTITHPSSPSKTYETTLWPVHCVANTPGAELHPSFDTSNIHDVLDKGKDERVEMYSAFYDPFKVEVSGLAERLKGMGVTDVFVVGLAADYCVKATAEHAVEEGFTTYIVEEGTKPVNTEGWEKCKQGITSKGVKMVSIDGDEVSKVKQFSQ